MKVIDIFTSDIMTTTSIITKITRLFTVVEHLSLCRTQRRHAVHDFFTCASCHLFLSLESREIGVLRFVSCCCLFFVVCERDLYE